MNRRFRVQKVTHEADLQHPTAFVAICGRTFRLATHVSMFAGPLCQNCERVRSTSQVSA
jgi:hypothetical protein